MTDGEFNSLRAKGLKRPVSILQIKSEARRPVSILQIKSEARQRYAHMGEETMRNMLTIDSEL